LSMLDEAAQRGFDERTGDDVEHGFKVRSHGVLKKDLCYRMRISPLNYSCVVSGFAHGRCHPQGWRGGSAGFADHGFDGMLDRDGRILGWRTKSMCERQWSQAMS
jgi:hypothetical protein